MSTARSIAILGLSITSSWGNGHASTWRALVRELCRRGHQVTFLERDVPWYRAHRDLPQPPYGDTRLYRDAEELRAAHGAALREADFVIVGSYVPESPRLCRWLLALRRGPVAFYDIDTPVTLAALAGGRCSYLSAELIPRFSLYLSFAGGGSLRILRERYGAQRPRALYCSVDPECHHPSPGAQRWDLGYLGTWAADRQPGLERLLIEPARALPRKRFVVAGSSYPPGCDWPENCGRIEHLPPAHHSGFFGAQRYTLNLTRADMIRAGHAPSVRLFEAAACGTAIISDRWPGIAELLTPDRDILLADSPADVIDILRHRSETERAAMAQRARQRVLSAHTAAHRAAELEGHMEEVLAQNHRRRAAAAR